MRYCCGQKYEAPLMNTFDMKSDECTGPYTQRTALWRLRQFLKITNDLLPLFVKYKVFIQREWLADYLVGNIKRRFSIRDPQPD